MLTIQYKPWDAEGTIVYLTCETCGEEIGNLRIHQGVNSYGEGLQLTWAALLIKKGFDHKC